MRQIQLGEEHTSQKVTEECDDNIFFPQYTVVHKIAASPHLPIFVLFFYIVQPLLFLFFLFVFLTWVGLVELHKNRKKVQGGWLPQSANVPHNSM